MLEFGYRELLKYEANFIFTNVDIVVIQIKTNWFPELLFSGHRVLVVQAGLRLAMRPRMTLNFGSSCLLHLNTENRVRCHST